MKRRASLRIYQETKDMTGEERLSWWRFKNEEFIRIQEKLSRLVKS
jgi:hypothetical protein